MHSPKFTYITASMVQEEIDKRKDGVRDLWRVILPLITAISGWPIGHFWKL
jgi:hypothetical protein